MKNQPYNFTILIPVYNDFEVLDELTRRLMTVLPTLSDNFEIVLIDDGSKDLSWTKIKQLASENEKITGIKLMRNFGQQNAIAAGLDYATGDITVIMDSDLQDKPEDIPLLIEALEKNNASMAISKWTGRKDGLFKRMVSKLFYHVSKRITHIHHQPNLGVFRAIRKEIVEELKKYPEKTSTSLSLLYWIGVDYVTVELKRDARFAGKSGYTIRKMLKLTFDRIFSFSMFPIRLASYMGFGIALLSFLSGLILIIRWFFDKVAPGWTSLIVLMLLLFGLNFLFLGIIGEYLGRIFIESKKRPKYIIQKIIRKE